MMYLCLEFPYGVDNFKHIKFNGIFPNCVEAENACETSNHVVVPIDTRVADSTEAIRWEQSYLPRRISHS